MMVAQGESRPLAVRPREAARLLGLSARMIAELISSGRLRSVRVGSARLIPMSVLERFVESTTERV